MCGICGKVALESGRPVDPEIVERMSRCIIHRGPDDSGIHVEGFVGLGFRRLSIIDLSAAGHQPMPNEDETVWIVFNGEVYNFGELRPGLEARGHKFRSRTDTEVVLHLYEEKGPACVEDLEGMFAFAIWDGPKNRLFMARDRLGIKPLYYTHRDGTLWFGSEIKSILEDPEVPREVSPEGLVNYVSYGHGVAPRTIYRGIEKLPPGHYLLYGQDGIKLERYWSVPPFSSDTDRGEAYYVEQTRAHLERSVKACLVSDAPLGAFLSGGMDSSAIVAVMSRRLDVPVSTFSLGFDAGEDYNELSDARIVANHFGTDHHELLISSRELAETVEKLAWHFDEPFGDPAALPVYLLSKFAREHVKVVLTGEGGDEMFGGYRRLAAEQLAPYFHSLPRAARRALVAAARPALRSRRRLNTLVNVLSVEDAPSRLAAWHAVFTPHLLAGVLDRRWLDAAGAYSPIDPYAEAYHSRMSALENKLHSDLARYLPDTFLEKTDKATMAASIEARVPFLQHPFVEFACSIPTRHKVKGSQMKRILKLAVADMLPQRILNKKKQGFAVPLDPWFKGPLKELTRDILLDPKTRERGYFNSAYVERLVDAHERGEEPNHEHIWLLINFELWHRHYIDAGGSGA